MKRRIVTSVFVLFVMAAIGRLMPSLLFGIVAIAAVVGSWLLWKGYVACRRSLATWGTRRRRVIMPKIAAAPLPAAAITWDHWDTPAILRKRDWSMAQLYAWIDDQAQRQSAKPSVSEPTLTLVPAATAAHAQVTTDEPIPSHLMVVPG